MLNSNKRSAGKSVSGWPKAGDLFLLAAVLAWGVNFPIAKFVLGYMPPVVFSATRYFAAAGILFVLLLINGQSLKINLKEAGMLLLIGFLGIALFQGGWAFGLSLTTASKASILVATSPVFGALLVSFRGEKTSFLGWVGVLVSLAGVAVIINNNLTEITVGGGSFLGDVLVIGAAFVWAIYTIVSGPMVMKRGPLWVTAWAMLFGAIILTGADLEAVLNTNYTAIPTLGWIAWFATAILGGALAFVWYCSGISRLGVARGMAYSFLIPVVAIATSIVFFGETLSFVQMGGVVIVMAGIQLTRRN